MKLYIAAQTCSLAAQIIANEIGLEPELVHYDVHDRTTSSGETFTDVNALSYVPVLVLDNDRRDSISETIVVTSYLADQHPEAGLIPPRGSLERVKFDQLLTFVATEIAQKHIPLMRKLLTEDGAAWTRAKLVAAYTQLDNRLADGRAFLTGDRLTVADAYVWATMWQERSGTEISHLQHLMDWKTRMDALPSVRKALEDEADIVAVHALKAAA
jgi:glutathione S-transferase